MNSKLKKITLLFIPLAIIIGWLFILDYEDFFSKKNIGGILGIIAMVFLLLSYFLNKKIRNNKF